MRSVLVVLLAAVPGPMFADLGGGGPDLGGGGPSPAPKTALKADPDPGPSPTPGMGWNAGVQAGPKPAVTLPPASLADAVRAATQAASAGNGSGALAFGGGWSAGIVIAPQPHPDDRPRPLGMVIEPPDVDDPMAIPPGCDGLQPRPPRRVTAGWRKPFADLARAADGTCPQVL